MLTAAPRFSALDEEDPPLDLAVSLLNRGDLGGDDVGAHQRRKFGEMFGPRGQAGPSCPQVGVAPGLVGEGVDNGICCWSQPESVDNRASYERLPRLGAAASSDENTAVDVTPGALMPACPRAYVRVFADESSPMALCSPAGRSQKAEQAAARSIPLGCLGRVLRGFGGRGTVQGSGLSVAAVPGLVEQLTAPELETLALLVAGMPNPHIAEQLEQRHGGAMAVAD